MSRTLNEEMGKRIARERKALNMTQEQLAEELEVSVQFISYIERGIKGVSLENLVRLTEVLNLSCDYLLTGERTQNENSAMIKKIEKLSAHDFEMINLLIDYCVNKE